MTMEFTITLLGNENVGKTSYLNRISKSREIKQKYVVTKTPSKISIKFKTNNGYILLHFLDSSTTEADSAIVMFGWAGYSDINTVARWKNTFNECSTKPVITIGNKIDLICQPNLAMRRQFEHRSKNIRLKTYAYLLCAPKKIPSEINQTIMSFLYSSESFNISIKKGSIQDLVRPILNMARKLTKNPMLLFV